MPGLIAADVCTMLAMVAPVPPSVLPSLTVRPVADTMPWVTLDDSPSGEPIASTIWPTSTFEESPNSAAFSPSGFRSSLMTARSCCGYVETSFAVNSSSLLAVVTLKVFSSPTTCAFVTMCPLSSYTTPEPRSLVARICTTDGRTSLITFW